MTRCWEVCKNFEDICKYHIGYINKLVGEYNNTYHCSVGKNLFDADCSALAEEIGTTNKPRTFKAGDKVRITKYNNIFSKDYTKKWTKKIHFIDSVFKNKPIGNPYKKIVVE